MNELLTVTEVDVACYRGNSRWTCSAQIRGRTHAYTRTHTWQCVH